MAIIERGTVWEDNGTLCMARVLGANGSAVQQADVSGIGRKVFDLSSTAPTSIQHSTTLTVADVIFDTLQTDSGWTKDATGFNFKDTVPSTLLATGNHRYRIEHTFTTTAQPYHTVFEVFAEAIQGS